MRYDEVVARLQSMARPDNRAGLARFGINTRRTYGISVPALRALAKEIGRDHALALEVWESGVRDTRILAAMIDDPAQVTEAQMEAWVTDLDSWDVCDGCCGVLFDKTPFAYAKAAEWSARTEEFVKRAAFALMASLAVHDKNAPDQAFLDFLPAISRESTDDRNYVRKAVNWALRQIGKRNLELNAAAIATAEQIRRMDSRSARWIASDALRELSGDKVQARLRSRS